MKRRWPLAIAAACVVAGLATAVLHVVVAPFDPDGTTGFVATNAVTAIFWGAVGGTVVHAGRFAPGGILLAIGVAHSLTGLGRELGLMAVGAGHTSLASWLLWFGTWPFFATLWFSVLLLLLPDGRLAGPRWKAVAWAGLLSPVPLMVTVALSPGPLLLSPVPGQPVPENPVGLVDLGGLPLLTVLLLAVSGPGALVSLAVRWRRGGTSRQQLKWVALAGAVLLVLGLGVEVVFPWIAPLVAPFSVAAFAVAMGVALVRHRLLDIDVVISRAFLYAALTGLLAGVYVAVSVLLGSALRGPVPDLVATTAVALSFAPARDALQRGMARLFYGLRDDPQEALRRVGLAVETSPSIEEVLPQLAGAMARALRLRFAAISLPGEDLPADVPPGATVVGLRHREAEVGQLVIASRDPSGRMSAQEERLLADLARQAATAAHAVLLTRELRRSRDQVVASREEERRRLSRDLHDGIGPLLTTVSLQLDAAVRLLTQDPDRSGALITEARSEVDQAVSEVRRLLQDLRPRALEELGLTAAVEAALGSLRSAGITTDLSMSNDLQLPPDTEVALFRILSEALNNVVRHAEASRVTVRIEDHDGEVAASVEDNGKGLGPQPTLGVGLVSMRERAEQLGGRLTVEATNRGTRVALRLPQRARTNLVGS